MVVYVGVRGKKIKQVGQHERSDGDHRLIIQYIIMHLQEIYLFAYALDIRSQHDCCGGVLATIFIHVIHAYTRAHVYNNQHAEEGGRCLLPGVSAFQVLKRISPTILLLEKAMAIVWPPILLESHGPHPTSIDSPGIHLHQYACSIHCVRCVPWCIPRSPSMHAYSHNVRTKIKVEVDLLKV